MVPVQDCVANSSLLYILFHLILIVIIYLNFRLRTHGIRDSDLQSRFASSRFRMESTDTYLIQLSQKDTRIIVRLQFQRPSHI